MTAQENEILIADVERELEADRDYAVASPMPVPESATGGVYCDSSCHEIRPKYGAPRVRTTKSGMATPRETAVHLK